MLAAITMWTPLGAAQTLQGTSLQHTHTTHTFCQEGPSYLSPSCFKLSPILGMERASPSKELLLLQKRKKTQHPEHQGIWGPDGTPW